MLLKNFQPLFEITQKIQANLIQIKNDIQTGTIKTCTLLRRHLIDHEPLYKTYIDPSLKSIEWGGSQLEPLDVINRLKEIFQLPDVLLQSFESYGANIPPEIAEPKDLTLTEKSERTESFTYIINPFSVQKFTGHSSIDSLIKTETISEFDPSNLFKSNGQSFIYRVEKINCLESPFLHIHLSRINEITDKLNDEILPSEEIILERNPRPLVLSSMIIHHSDRSHYTSYLKCKGKWYHFDDMPINGDKLKRIGTLSTLLSSKVHRNNVLSNATDYFYF